MSESGEGKSCPCTNKEVLNSTKSIVNDFIKEKETDLRLTKEEYANTPDRYKVKKIIKQEIDDLTTDIDHMKDTVNKLG